MLRAKSAVRPRLKSLRGLQRVSRPRVVILGAGFGGLSAAYTIKAEAPDADILLIDRRPDFQMGLRKLWVLEGSSAPEDGARARSLLNGRGLRFLEAAATSIDLAKNEVVTEQEHAGYDFLVIALGAEGRADLIPGGGLADNPNLYSMEGVVDAHRRLEQMQSGRIAIVIAGLPYKCPPAAYEAAFLIDDILRRTGRREKVSLDVLTPQPTSIPSAGTAACTAVEGRMDQRDINFTSSAKIKALERGRVVMESGNFDADLLLVIPPHRPPSVVASAGLGGEGGFIAVDPKTMKTEHDNVYAVGDVVAMKTGAGLPFPKAGVFAEAHGNVAGRNIAATINGKEPDAAFDGNGYCFMEVGGGAATSVKGNFLTAPPQVTVAEAGPEHLAAKRTFEAERLERWFGPAK